MAYAPKYTPQVAPAEGTNARFQPQDFGGGWLGGVAEGLRTLGKAGADYADADDAVQAHYDDTYARKLALEYQQRAAPIMSQFSTLQGQNAIDARPDVEKQLKGLSDEISARASNPRMKEYLGVHMDPLVVDNSSKVIDFALRGQAKMAEDVAGGEMDNYAEQAASSYKTPDIADQNIANGLDSLSRYAKIKGWSAPVAEQQQRKYLSGIRRAGIDAMLADDNPDIEMADAYFHAHQDEMTFDDRNAALKALQPHLQLRDNINIFNDTVSGTPPAVARAGGGNVSGTYHAPVAGKITSEYGARRPDGEVHSGLDIAAPAGSAIHPIAEGTVTQSGWDQKGGGWFVRIKHPDGTSSSYAHMQVKPTLKDGDIVGEDDVIGTVGMTGHATGPHVHLSVFDANGQRVNPENVLGKEFAGNVAPPTQPRNWDQTSVISSIRARGKLAEDDPRYLSPEQVERASDYAKSRMNEDEGLIADQEQDASRAASDQVLALGDKFTDPGQIDRSTWNKMSPAARMEYTNLAKANKAGPTLKADGPDAITLRLKAILQPDDFLKENLGTHVGKMTNGELSEFAAKQATMLADKKKDAQTAATKAAQWTPNSGVVTAFNNGASLNGIKFSDGDKASVLTLMMDDAQRLFDANGHKPLTDADYQRLFTDATKTTRYKQRVFGIQTHGDIERYKLGDEVSNAKADLTSRESGRRSRVVEAFRKANHRDPNEAEINRWLGSPEFAN